MVMQMSNKPAGAFFTSKSKNVTLADDEHIRLFLHELSLRMEQRLAYVRRLLRGETETGESWRGLSQSHTRV